MRASCQFRLGPQLKRLLVTLAKAKPRKSPRNPAAKSAWQFSPSDEEKKRFLIQQKENAPLPSHLLLRMPMLQRWLERGGGEKNEN
jgi:hypothetical protein